MLKKLFKYEWKDSWKILGIMNIVVVVFSLLGTLIVNEKIWEAAENNEYIAIAVVFYMMFYIGAIIALSLCTGFYFYYRFYKNFYTDEGYLMHTLPVTPHQLIWSKTFVALIWQTISGFVVMFSIINFVNYCGVAEGETSIWLQLGEVLGKFWGSLEGYMVPFIIVMVIYCMIAPFFSIFLGYASISLGQCTKKHKLLAAVGIYFGITSLMQMGSSMLTVPLTMYLESFVVVKTVEEAFMYLTIVFAFLALVIAGVAALFYFLSYHTMKKRLNLE